MEASSALLAVPAGFVDVIALQGWYMLLYRLGSQEVHIFSWSRSDLIALASVLFVSGGIRCELYMLSSGGTTFTRDVI